MSKVKQYIEQATNERIRSRGLKSLSKRLGYRETKRGGKLSKCINKCVRLRTAKVVRVGFINRKRNRPDAMGIAPGLDYLLTDWIGSKRYVYNQAYSMQIGRCVRDAFS